MSWWYRRSVEGGIAIPEGLPLSLLAAIAGPEMADGMRPVLAPAHPGQLQPLAHHRLAGGLHRPAADTPAPRRVFGVLRPVRVPLQVSGQLGHRLVQARSPGPVPLAQDRRQHGAALLLEPPAPLPRLFLGPALVLRVEQPRQPG